MWNPVLWKERRDVFADGGMEEVFPYSFRERIKAQKHGIVESWMLRQIGGRAHSVKIVQKNRHRRGESNSGLGNW